MTGKCGGMGYCYKKSEADTSSMYYITNEELYYPYNDDMRYPWDAKVCAGDGLEQM